MKRLAIVLVAIAALALPSAAGAELIRITPLGVSVADYSGPLDPVPIGADGFRLTYHGGGSQELVNPVILILGIPDLSLDAPAVTQTDTPHLPTATVDLGGSRTMYGGSWNTTTGSAGTFSSTTNPKVYDYIGFTPKGSDSENYTNWNGATGLTAWNLFVYALFFDPNMQRGDYVEFRTSLPSGSYVIGYGCTQLDANGLCVDQPGKGNNSTTESTPFTFAGLVTQQVPEPSSALLLVLGSGVLVGFGRRGYRK